MKRSSASRVYCSAKSGSPTSGCPVPPMIKAVVAVSATVMVSDAAEIMPKIARHSKRRTEPTASPTRQAQRPWWLHPTHHRDHAAPLQFRGLQTMVRLFRGFRGKGGFTNISCGFAMKGTKLLNRIWLVAGYSAPQQKENSFDEQNDGGSYGGPGRGFIEFRVGR